jgi:hypothetical protein
MARTRQRAATRKAAARAGRDEATVIADGVYHVARETLAGTPRGELPLPVYAYAPVAYATEMMAAVICRQRNWPDDRAHQVALYLLAGVQEVMVAAFSGFDPEHFEAWIGAAGGSEVTSG